MFGNVCIISEPFSLGENLNPNYSKEWYLFAIMCFMEGDLYTGGSVLGFWYRYRGSVLDDITLPTFSALESYFLVY